MKFVNSAELIFVNYFGIKEQLIVIISQFFGYKIHAITTCKGVVKLFEITFANVDDRKGLEDFSSVLPTNCTIIADKGYQSHNLEKNLADIGIFLLALRRNNSIENYSASFR